MSSRTKISFGSYIDSDVRDISHEELLNKVDSGENMIVTSYYGVVTSCQCQSIFNEILKEYVMQSNYVIYSFNNEEIDGSKDKYGFVNFGYSNPSLYIVNSGKIVNKYFYSQKAHENIFSNISKLGEIIGKSCIKPDFYYVDDEYITSYLPSQEKVGVCFARSGCPDCNYLMPSFIIPFGKSHNLSVKTWIFDMQSYYGTDDYRIMKNKYNLSEDSNPTYGYLDGRVPTIQYYENGNLKSACVYFNDIVGVKNESDYFIETTYYTSERIDNLDYLTTEFVLENKQIEKEETALSSWIASYASVYHNQIIEKFYNYYFI